MESIPRSPTSSKSFRPELQEARPAEPAAEPVSQVKVDAHKIGDVYAEIATVHGKKQLAPAARLPAEVVEQ